MNWIHPWIELDWLDKNGPMSNSGIGLQAYQGRLCRCRYDIIENVKYCEYTLTVNESIL